MSNKNEGRVLTPRKQLENKISNARSNLLFVVGFTIVNIIFAVTNRNTYFLFSAFVPYFIANLGMALCGKYSADFYDADFPISATFGDGAFVVFVAISVILTLVYLLMWRLSKNLKKGWLIAALVFFAVDTLLLFLLSGDLLENIIDVAFHIWVIVSLSIGINSAAKLEKMPQEDEPIVEEIPQTESVPAETATTFKRVADMEVKQRVLAEAELEGHKIVYRRVKKVNELVIDGYVYDEYVALMEYPHELYARIDGKEIVAGYDGMNSFIKVGGQIIAKKIRIF
ncbi:MAG: hypothetical protein E7537_05195 [Ruminococcaceae bacterium]|nr:hypothetical protein [Oscillospiraceae bacterium]